MPRFVDAVQAIRFAQVGKSLQQEIGQRPRGTGDTVEVCEARLRELRTVLLDWGLSCEQVDGVVAEAGRAVTAKAEREVKKWYGLVR